MKKTQPQKKIIIKKNTKKIGSPEKIIYDSKNPQCLEYIQSRNLPIFSIELHFPKNETRETTLYLCGGSYPDSDISKIDWDKFIQLLKQPRIINKGDLDSISTNIDPFLQSRYGRGYPSKLSLTKKRSRNWINVCIFQDDTILTIYRKIRSSIQDVDIESLYLWTTIDSVVSFNELEHWFFQSLKNPHNKSCHTTEINRTLANYSCVDKHSRQIIISPNRNWTLEEFCSIPIFSRNIRRLVRIGGYPANINSLPIQISPYPFNDNKELEGKAVQWVSQHDYLLSDYIDIYTPTLHLACNDTIPSQYKSFFYNSKLAEIKIKTTEDQYLQNYDSWNIFLWKYLWNPRLPIQMSLIQNIVSSVTFDKDLSLDLESVFDNIKIDDKVPFTKYTHDSYTPSKYRIYRHIHYDPVTRKNLVDFPTYQQWTKEKDGESYFSNRGISLRLKQHPTKNYSDPKYGAVNVFPNGRIECKFYWQEYQHATLFEVEKTLNTLQHYHQQLSNNSLLKNTLEYTRVPDSTFFQKVSPFTRCHLINFNVRTKFPSTNIPTFKDLRSIASKLTQYWIEIESNTTQKSIHFRYRKISCFDEKSSITHYIDTQKKIQISDTEIIAGLQKQFRFTPEEALKEFDNWQSSKVQNSGDFFYNRQNYPGIDIKINYGGQQPFRKLGAGELAIRIEGVKSIYQLRDVSRFIQSFIQICYHYEHIMTSDEWPEISNDEAEINVDNQPEFDIHSSSNDFSSSDNSDSNSNSLGNYSDNSDYSDAPSDAPSDTSDREFVDRDSINSENSVEAQEEEPPQIQNEPQREIETYDDEYVVNRLKQTDPKLFSFKKVQKSNTLYATFCQKAQQRQPIVLSQAEKDRIDQSTNPIIKNSYYTLDREEPKKIYQYLKSIKDHAEIKAFGSFPKNVNDMKSWIHYNDAKNIFEKDLYPLHGSPGKKNYYICPQYWCIRCNTSLNSIITTIDKSGKTINRCPICNGFEVDSKKSNNTVDHTLLIRNDSYWTEGDSTKPAYVGFQAKSDQHPEGLCMPCCYKQLGKVPGEKNKFELRNRTSCLGNKKTEIKVNEYLKSPDKIPLESEKLGVLPQTLNRFFDQEIEAGSLSSLAKRQGLPFFNPVYTRIGCNQSQPFLSAITSVMKSPHQSELQINDIINEIEAHLTPSRFAHLQQGQIVNIFCPYSFRYIKDNLFQKSTYKEFVYYYATLPDDEKKLFGLQSQLVEWNKVRQLDTNRLQKYIILFKIFSARKQFIKYLSDSNQFKDHTYLWDLVCLEGIVHSQGFNLIIFENDSVNKSEITIKCHPVNKPDFRPSRPIVYLLQHHNKYYEVISLVVSKEQAKRELSIPDKTPLGKELQHQEYLIDQLPPIITLRYFNHIDSTYLTKLQELIIDGSKALDHPSIQSLQQLQVTRTLDALETLTFLNNSQIDSDQYVVVNQYVNSVLQITHLKISFKNTPSLQIWIPVNPSSIVLPTDISSFTNLIFNHNLLQTTPNPQDLFVNSYETTIRCLQKMSRGGEIRVINTLFTPQGYKTNIMGEAIYLACKNGNIPITPTSRKLELTLDKNPAYFDSDSIWSSLNTTDNRINFINHQTFQWETYQRLRLEVSRLLNIRYFKDYTHKSKQKRDNNMSLKSFRKNIINILEKDIPISEKRERILAIINNMVQKHISVNPAPSLSKKLTENYHQEIPKVRKSCQYNTRKKNPHCNKNRLIIPREKFSIFLELLVDEIVRSNPQNSDLFNGIKDNLITTYNSPVSNDLYQILSPENNIVRCGDHDLHYTHLWFDNSSLSKLLESRSQFHQPRQSDYHHFPYKNTNYPQNGMPIPTSFGLLYTYFYIYHPSTVAENWKSIIDSLENTPGNIDNFRNLAETSFRMAKSQSLCDKLNIWKEQITWNHFDVISQKHKINMIILDHDKSIKSFKHPESVWNIIFYKKNSDFYRIGLQMPMKNNIFHFKTLPRDINFLTVKKKTKKFIPKK